MSKGLASPNHQHYLLLQALTQFRIININMSTYFKTINIVILNLIMGLIFCTVSAESQKSTSQHDSNPKIQKHTLLGRPYVNFMKIQRITQEMSLDKPSNIALSPKKIFVSDTAKKAVLILRHDGSLEKTLFGPKDNPIAYPNSLTVDLDNLLVTDRYESKIYHFKTDGRFVKVCNIRGDKPGQDTEIRGIAVHPLGYIFIGAHNRDKIMQFDIARCKFIKEFGSSGDREGQIFGITDITIDEFGNIWEVDLNHRIQKFGADGTFIANWGKKGTDLGQFENPQSITIDQNGLVYIADTKNGRIQRLSLSYKDEAPDKPPDLSFGDTPNDNSRLKEPTGVAVAPDGTVLVADPRAGKITFWKQMDSSGPPPKE